MTKTTDPWMPVSILLGVLLIASFITNVVMINKIIDVKSGTTGGQVYVPPSGNDGGAVPPTVRADVSADDDPMLGDKDAPVTIIEFSDFQCPFCKRWHDQTFAQIKANYIDTGKANLVYRDYPLSFHQNAQQSAEAAECADEQGKFWEYHEVLFAKGAGDGTGLNVADLKQYAADLKLDTKKFDSCLDSHKYATEVAKDTSDGSAAGVSGTPSFFINGQQLVGAQPYSAFQQAIDAALNE
jgi:protein-disulfide isomerase